MTQREERNQRLAERLRANLKRRKAQVRDRESVPGADGSAPDDAMPDDAMPDGSAAGQPTGRGGPVPADAGGPGDAASDDGERD